MKVSLYADLFKHTEYGLDNPAKNHKGELYETYQYVTAYTTVHEIPLTFQKVTI